MKKVLIWLMVSVLLLLLSACGENTPDIAEEDYIKTGQTDNIKELVHEYSLGLRGNEIASITSHQLIVTDSDLNKLTYELPEDEFFVSIAPYIENTHP